jgi:hypothetical protein
LNRLNIKILIQWSIFQTSQHEQYHKMTQMKETK